MPRIVLITIILLLPLSGQAYADCTDPPGFKGEREYFLDEHGYKFCNGSVWVGMSGGGSSGLPPGSLDVSFDSSTGATGPSYSNNVRAIAVQPDGKIVIGGNFRFYNGTARENIARITADGSLDTSFNPGSGTIGPVDALALQPDGKIVIGGGFTKYNGTARNYIARINAGGSLDTAFNPGGGAQSNIYALALQPDGKIVIGGDFTSYNGTARNRIARLNADGSLDTSFNPGSGVNTGIRAVALQPDGKIVIGGNFTSYDGTARGRIARLNTNSWLDTGFNPDSGASAYIWAIAVQPDDGKIVIGGDFPSYNGTARNKIARLNTDGSLDTGFDPGSGASSASQVYAVAVQSDGKIVIGGTFTSYNGTARSKVARLNADGSLDTSFDPGSGATGVDNIVNAITVQPDDGKIVIGGSFTAYNGTARSKVVRIMP